MLVSVFWVLQGSAVPPVMYGEIYDMDFVARFMENMTVKKNFENRSTFVKVMNESIVAQFLLRHGVCTLFRYIQGGSKKVSCCTVSTAYFFEPPCTFIAVSNWRVLIHYSSCSYASTLAQ